MLRRLFQHRHIGGSLPGGHLGVEVEEFIQPLSVVLNAAANVDAVQSLVVPLVRFPPFGADLDMASSISIAFILHPKTLLATHG